MTGPGSQFANPFSVTKAVDLNDDQIQALWVSMSGSSQQFAEFAKPTTHVPLFIMGAKGSGKTHLMRYHAFELQILRYKFAKKDLRSGIKSDGYIGVYVRCGGLNSERFSGKRQPAEKWSILFSYYIELWLTQILVEILIDLQLGARDGDEQELCREIYGLFDHPPQEMELSLVGFKSTLSQIRRELDYAINNCVMTGRLEVEILFTRGRLIFGIPKILAARYDFLREVMFVYSLDEFENLTADQQKFINTLVREKDLPSTIRIGSRLYGVKTNATLSDNEENLQDSEFEKLTLDRLFRTHKDRYAFFARSLVEKRLMASYGIAGLGSRGRDAGIDWSRHFETVDWSWRSRIFLDIVKNKPSRERRHFIVLAEKLNIFGYNPENVEMIIRLLSCEPYPLIEKVCVLLLYQDLSRNIDPMRSAAAIADDKSRFVEAPPPKSRIDSNLDHYKGDLIAQLNRENDVKQAYVGLDTFIMMSAGLPRGLLTILRSVYEWSHFQGEEPLQGRKISKESQIKGVRDAADWFYDNMRKSGDDGVAIQTVIDRLARLFRANRFSDKPTECSLIAFSFSETGVSNDARRLINLCESRSFLNRIVGGQKDRNSERVTMKFQINNMLSPRWDLPLGRRGTQNFDSGEINMIFDISKETEFESFLESWKERRTAPFFGKTRPHQTESAKQGNLF